MLHFALQKPNCQPVEGKLGVRYYIDLIGDRLAGQNASFGRRQGATNE